MVLRGQVQRSGFRRNGFQARRQTADLLRAEHDNDERKNAENHNKALQKVGLERRDVAAEDDQHRRRKRDDDHTKPLVDVQQHRAHARQALVNRRGIGN